MIITARVYRGNITCLYQCPVPFKDQSGRTIGNVVSVAFDGEYTVATIEVTDEQVAQDLAGKYKPRAMIHGDINTEM